MSKAKFTEGEWGQSHRKGSGGMYNTEVYDHKGETICILAWHAVDEGNGVTSTDREANAHLIAAAPDMYNLLERLTSYDNCKKDIIHLLGEADSLLAKARGES